MSEKYGIVTCTLCGREYKMYDRKEKTKVYGLSYVRSKTWQPVLTIVDCDKSEVNKHICTYCVADIVNKFGI